MNTVTPSPHTRPVINDHVSPVIPQDYRFPRTLAQECVRKMLATDMCVYVCKCSVRKWRVTIRCKLFDVQPAIPFGVLRVHTFGWVKHASQTLVFHLSLEGRRLDGAGNCRPFEEHVPRTRWNISSRRPARRVEDKIKGNLRFETSPLSFWSEAKVAADSRF